jgi:hypothetical protein
MSEYFLADRRARERAKAQEELKKPAAPKQDARLTLLGDFLFPSAEPQGSDPYNSTQGKSGQELWRTRSERR